MGLCLSNVDFDPFAPDPVAEQPNGPRWSFSSGASQRATTLYSVGRWRPDHDAVMRICDEAPGGGPILENGVNTMACYG
jgi:hypothetical protein